MHTLLPLLTAVTLQAQTSYERVIAELRDLAPQPAGVAGIHRAILRRDALELRLDSGRVHLLTPVAGRLIGVAYTGRGWVSFVPSLAMERAHLRRVMEDTAIHGPIVAAVLIFTDTTFAELRRVPSHGAAEADPDARGVVKDALEFLVDGRTRTADASLMMRLLNDSLPPDGYFAAFIKRERGEPVMVRIDPDDLEEVQLLRRGRMVNQRTEIVCQFERAEDLRRADDTLVQRSEPMAIEDYAIESTIDGTYDFSARARLRIVGRPGGGRHGWVPLRLYHELEIDSVTSGAGGPLPYYRPDESSELWVQLDRPVGPGESRIVRIAYHGDLIGFGSAIEDFLPPWWTEVRRRRPPVLDQWAFIKSTGTWYPRYSFWQPATMELTFHTPHKLQFASIGRLVESRTEGDVLTTRWVTEAPTQQASFNIGRFEELKVTDPRIPPVTVHVNSEAHAGLRAWIPHARDPEKAVVADVSNSLAFFTQTFGPPPFQHFYATEIPYFHGQAFPGLIHLSWSTFIGGSPNGADESFRAHEMAHQWWGIGVEPATYRDAWISEGFSQFAGLWYMQSVLRDNDKYFKQLREARDEIRRQRKSAAPIGLGYRAAENWRGGYSVVVYQKGAWVLHMLRNMLLDLRTMEETAFTRLMQDFYTSYRGRHAGTRDFQRVVERHVNAPMDWFFRQWVYSTEVPTYIYSWTTEPQPDGRHLLRLRVRQEDVPQDFVMRVPLLIEFPQGQALVRVTVDGPLSETSLMLPAEPKRLELNALESVLADVKTEGWRN